MTALPSGDAAFDTHIYYKTFVRAADLLVLNVVVYANPADDGFILFGFPPQHIVESQQNTPSPVAPDDGRVTFWHYDYLNAPAGAFLWPAPNNQMPSGRFLSWWGDLEFTQGTRLCFRLESGAAAVLAAAETGDLATLLNWSAWPLCLPPWGLSAASFNDAPIGIAESPPASQADAEVASTLAMIFGLVLTQTDTAGWTHLDQPAPLRGRTELWHTRLAGAQASIPPTLRAIWSLPQAVSASGGLWDGLPGTGIEGDPTHAYEPDTALTTGTVAQDDGSDLRVTLVNYTSSLQNEAAELPAHDVLLSAMGGSLTTGYARAVTFHHKQVLGRDVDDSSLVSSLLLPFGHPVTVQAHRVRQIDENGFASFLDIITVRVINPVVTAGVNGLSQPFSTVTLLTTTIPPFLNGLGKPPAVMLDYLGVDYAGSAIRLQAALALRGSIEGPMTVLVNQQRVTYAAGFAAPGLAASGVRPSDLPMLSSPASLVTDLLMVQTNPDANAYWVTQAQIRHAAVAHFRTDADAASAVALLVVPPTIAAGVSADSLDMLAMITGSVDSAGTALGLPSVTAAAQSGLGGLDTSRFGGFAAPQMAPAYLSKTFGAAGATLDQLTGAAAAGEAQLKAAAQQAIGDLLGQTKLFGLFPLSDLLGSVLEQSQQDVDQLQGWVAQNGPQLAEPMDATSKTVTLTLDATPPADGGLFTKTLGPVGFLEVTLTAAMIGFTSTVTTSLADPQSSVTSARGSIGSPSIALTLSGEESGVRIDFTELVFTSASNAKPSFTTGFNGFSFTGDLAFINGIMAVLPSSIFSNPPQTTVDDTHAEVACSVGLPAFGFGVFDFRNVSLGADAIIRFDPSAATLDGDPGEAPLEFGFDFGTPDSPFSCAVTLLEGQGSFGLSGTPAGVTLDCSMAFGGAFEIDLVVVSGGVSITAGLHLTKTPQSFDIAGFVHLSGGVEVLDIIGVTLDAMLSLSYASADREFTGSVQVTIGISVLFFHQDVTFGLTESFSLDALPALVRPDARAAASELPDPFAARPSPVLGYANVWDDYCAGFAA